MSDMAIFQELRAERSVFLSSVAGQWLLAADISGAVN
jgi:hypothetical protein